MNYNSLCNCCYEKWKKKFLTKINMMIKEFRILLIIFPEK